MAETDIPTASDDDLTWARFLISPFSIKAPPHPEKPRDVYGVVTLDEDQTIDEASTLPGHITDSFANTIDSLSTPEDRQDALIFCLKLLVYSLSALSGDESKRTLRVLPALLPHILKLVAIDNLLEPTLPSENGLGTQKGPETHIIEGDTIKGTRRSCGEGKCGQARTEGSSELTYAEIHDLIRSAKRLALKPVCLSNPPIVSMPDFPRSLKGSSGCLEASTTAKGETNETNETSGTSGTNETIGTSGTNETSRTNETSGASKNSTEKATGEAVECLRWMLGTVVQRPISHKYLYNLFSSFFINKIINYLINSFNRNKLTILFTLFHAFGKIRHKSNKSSYCTSMYGLILSQLNDAHPLIHLATFSLLDAAIERTFSRPSNEDMYNIGQTTIATANIFAILLNSLSLRVQIRPVNHKNAIAKFIHIPPLRVEEVEVIAEMRALVDSAVRHWPNGALHGLAASTNHVISLDRGIGQLDLVPRDQAYFSALALWMEYLMHSDILSSPEMCWLPRVRSFRSNVESFLRPLFVLTDYLYEEALTKAWPAFHDPDRAIERFRELGLFLTGELLNWSLANEGCFWRSGRSIDGVPLSKILKCMVLFVSVGRGAEGSEHTELQDLVWQLKRFVTRCLPPAESVDGILTAIESLLGLVKNDPSAASAVPFLIGMLRLMELRETARGRMPKGLLPVLKKASEDQVLVVWVPAILDTLSTFQVCLAHNEATKGELGAETIGVLEKLVEKGRLEMSVGGSESLGLMLWRIERWI